MSDLPILRTPLAGPSSRSLETYRTPETRPGQTITEWFDTRALDRLLAEVRSTTARNCRDALALAREVAALPDHQGAAAEREVAGLIARDSARFRNRFGI